jgi:glycosyltransferase involved in cell wall biosynthesis
MALRLTSTVTEQPAAELAPEQLLERAAALLRRGELDAYVALFAEAAGLADQHRRHQARKLLVEAAFGAAGSAERRRVAALYLTAAEQLVQILEEEPREPVLVNYLGVALYELGALKPAERCFKAARHCDPTLPEIERNLREVARRRRAGLTGLALAPALAARMPALTRRAEQAAGRARPAEGLRLSLCMIVRDEEEMLPRSLAAVRDAVDEIVVVDTGSTDRTKEIALEFGARVIDHEWTGSFSEARNVSFDAATGDWILYLDADEVLVDGDAERLRALLGRTWREAFFLVETNFTGQIEDGTATVFNALRLFRNRPEYRFTGRLHEQIAHTLPAYLPERLEVSDVRVEHYGYLGAVRDAKEKSRRNIELLERQAAEGADDAFLHYNLGSEYAAAGDKVAALDRFERAWGMVKGEEHPERYPYLPSLVDRLTKALRLNDRVADARALTEEGLRRFPGFTDLVMEQAQCALADGDREQAARLLERCLEMGDAPSTYSATVGAGTYLAAAALADLRLREGDAAGAETLLRRSLAEHGRFLGAVLPWATAALAAGRDPETVDADAAALLDLDSPTVRFLLGTALYERGHVDAAEAHYLFVCGRQPTNGAARLGLTECLLSRSAWDEAAEAAAAVPAEAAVAPLARRAEAFARIAARDAAGARAALARPAELTLSEHERQALLAFATVLEGGEAPALPARAADAIEVALEALLRVQELELYETLLPVLDAVALAQRERRERLARVYLRRGFLESAADEWIAVVQEQGPDADAMVGLAQVAWARELPDDARVFAAEAVGLDPAHGPARRLAERLSATT